MIYLNYRPLLINLILFSSIRCDEVLRRIKDEDFEIPAILPQPPLPAWCVGCLCKIMSGCQKDVGKCETTNCGPFKLTKAIWTESGSPQFQSNVETVFDECANDVFCSTKAIQLYADKYFRDCNEDNQTTCFDFIAIYNNGPFDCKLPLDTYTSTLYNECFESAAKNLNLDKNMK